MDMSTAPALIPDEIVLKDGKGKLASVEADRVKEDDTVCAEIGE